MSLPTLPLLMDDQHRWDFLGCAGAEFVHTPNIDRLAERGMRFTHCFTNSPVCGPARCSLATGLMPHRIGPAGIHDNADSTLPHDAVTYYQRLRDHGYRVACWGKLDLDKPGNKTRVHTAGRRPDAYRWGFTDPCEIEGKIQAGQQRTEESIGPYGEYLRDVGHWDAFHADYLANGSNPTHVRESVVPEEAFLDNYVARRALEWLGRYNQPFPWHGFVSFPGPHDPFDPPARYATPYNDLPLPRHIEDTCADKPAYAQKKCRQTPDAVIRHARRNYCGYITLIDERIGELLAMLETRHCLDNTYIVFTSDHGELLGDHGMWTKSAPYEGAWHIPLIVAGPGIEAGSTSDALVELSDLNPTLCELAGLAPQPDIDARSFAGVLRGETTEHRDYVGCHIRQFRAIRTATHKYVRTSEGETELYDLVNDPQELQNRTTTDPDRAATMQAQLEARFA